MLRKECSGSPLIFDVFWVDADISMSHSELSFQLRDTWNSLPTFYRSEAYWITERPSFNTLVQILVYLDYLYSDFLLKRVLMRRGHTTPIDLLAVAHRLLSTVLILVSERDRFLVSTNDFTWSVNTALFHIHNISGLT